MNRQMLIIIIGCIVIWMTSGCGERKEGRENKRVTVPIIHIKCTTEGQQYIVLLNGRKSEAVGYTDFKTKISTGAKPSLSFTVNGYGKTISSPDYEFIFSGHAQAKEYLHVESGEYMPKAPLSDNASCFIATVKEER